MAYGTIFDIEEGSIYGGTHLGITIYLKGCEVGCCFCHSPEGQNPQIEKIKLANNNVKIIGEKWSAERLATYMINLNSSANLDFVFSGGEPLYQGEFLLEVFKLLDGKFNIILDTSGYCPNIKLFEEVVSKVKFVDYGLKFIDFLDSLKYTNVTSFIQLRNLLFLDQKMTTEYQLVIPLIPGIFDTEQYQNHLKKLCTKLARCKKIVFNKFNDLTSAKYLAYKFSQRKP